MFKISNEIEHIYTRETRKQFISELLENMRFSKNPSPNYYISNLTYSLYQLNKKCFYS